MASSRRHFEHDIVGGLPLPGQDVSFQHREPQSIQGLVMVRARPLLVDGVVLLFCCFFCRVLQNHRIMEYPTLEATHKDH